MCEECRWRIEWYELVWLCVVLVFFFQAEDGIRDAQESRGLGDVYKRQRLKSTSILKFEIVTITFSAGLCAKTVPSGSSSDVQADKKGIRHKIRIIAFII